MHQNSERLATVLGNMAEGVIAVSTDEKILLANEASRKLLDITVANPLDRPLLEVTRSLAVHAAFVEALQSSDVGGERVRVGRPDPPARCRCAPRACRASLPRRGAGVPRRHRTAAAGKLAAGVRRQRLARTEDAAGCRSRLTPKRCDWAPSTTRAPHCASSAASTSRRSGCTQLILDLFSWPGSSRAEAFEHRRRRRWPRRLQDCIDQLRRRGGSRSRSLRRSRFRAASRDARPTRRACGTILDNLVDNAIKYTPASGRVTRPLAARTGRCRARGAGHGHRHPENDQARIFERFYRVDKARSARLGGTGLGLSIVKHLAQAFGGSVGLESRPSRDQHFASACRWCHPGRRASS